MHELIHSMHLTPKIMLPRRPVFNLRSPKTTDPVAWRELFTPLLDNTTNSIDHRNIERVLSLITIADECGSTRISVQMKRDSQHSDGYGSHDKWLEFEAFFKNSSDEMNFNRRLCEIE